MAAVAENGVNRHQQQHRASPASSDVSDSSKSEFQRDVRELVDLLSKLNPSAKEFIPSSYSSPDSQFLTNNLSFNPPFFTLTVPQKDSNNEATYNNRRINGLVMPHLIAVISFRVNHAMLEKELFISLVFLFPKKNNFGQGRRRLNGRALRAQREDSVRRTVYVSDIDQNITEEHLASLFINCGQVVDCRVCGDPHSVLRFAFVEFADEQGAQAALHLAGTMLGYYPVRVLPSKTAILPVNPTFLPRSEDEREMCARTVYCTNIDKEVTQNDVKVFFESICGEVSRLRLLGDHVHSTRIAFVEFTIAESAIVALSCSGMVLGSLPIRVSPSKTPVRPRIPRAELH